MTLHRCTSGFTIHLFQEGAVQTLCRLACASFHVVSDETSCTCGRCVEEAGALVSAGAANA